MNIDKVKMIRKKVCEGCVTYAKLNENNTCLMPHMKNGIPCPCSQCLIKMVCNEVCAKLEEYGRIRRKKRIVKRPLENYKEYRT